MQDQNETETGAYDNPEGEGAGGGDREFVTMEFPQTINL